MAFNGTTFDLTTKRVLPPNIYAVTFKAKNDTRPNTDAMGLEYSIYSSDGPWTRVGSTHINNSTCNTLSPSQNFVEGTTVWVHLLGETNPVGGLSGPILSTSATGTACPAIGTTGYYWTYTINATQTISTTAAVDGSGNYTY